MMTTATRCLRTVGRAACCSAAPFDVEKAEGDAAVRLEIGTDSLTWDRHATFSKSRYLLLLQS